jgi:putative ABC transport system substrate-binding protein
MNRRTFIAALGGAVAWPWLARGQRRAMPVVGVLSSRSLSESAPLVAALRQGMSEGSYIEGKNVLFTFRWAEGKYDHLRALAVELAQSQVAVIAALGGDVSTLAAKAATSTIPIVFAGGSDPTKFGVVESLNHPGGNVTGATLISGELVGKRLQLLREMVPTADTISMLINPDNPNSESDIERTQAAARAVGQQFHVVMARAESDFNAAFASVTQGGAGAVLVNADPLFTTTRERIIALAARYKLPAMYAFREFTAAGGLVSYGASLDDVHRQAGLYIAKILNGAKSGDLPILQPTKFELEINLKTAKALGLTIPDSIIARADKVIE